MPSNDAPFGAFLLSTRQKTRQNRNACRDGVCLPRTNEKPPCGGFVRGLCLRVSTLPAAVLSGCSCSVCPSRARSVKGEGVPPAGWDIDLTAPAHVQGIAHSAPAPKIPC